MYVSLKMATAEVLATNDKVEEVLDNLFDIFDGILEHDIIISVASNCRYNLEATTNTLLEMMNNNGKLYAKTKTESIDSMPVNGGFSYANAASSQKYRANADVIIESETIRNSKPASTNINMDPTKNVSIKSKQRSKKELNVERIIQHIRQESKILVLMRGLPGSGKSYLAKTIVDRSVGMPDYNLFIMSTDDYFYEARSGRYEYNVTKLQEAHEWNQQRAYMKMSTGSSPVIIDNTNSQMWEMKPYVTMAVNFGYIVEIAEPFTPWAFDVKQLFSRNTHNVPKVKLNDMLLRYEKDITPVEMFSQYKLSYVNNVPPIKRTFPPLRSQISCKVAANDDTIIPHVVREINLMAFDDDSRSNGVITISDDSNEVANSNLNIFDSALMDTGVNTEAVILKPSVRNDCSDINTPPESKKVCNATNNTSRSTINVIKSKPKKPLDIYPTLNLSSWGLSEDAVSSWESWDMVTPLTDSNSPVKYAENSASTKAIEVVDTANASTNTSSSDFSLLNTNCLTLASDSINIIRATGRDINANRVVTSPATPAKRALFDKSSMTDDQLNIEMAKDDAPVEEDIQQLITMFPTIPDDYLQDIYEKCNRDINWAVDLLLEDKKDILTDFTHQTNKRAERNVAPNVRETTVYEPVGNSNYNSKPSINSDEMNQLKKHIEGSVEINRGFYSDHVMKIKNIKQGSDNISRNLNEPSSSKGFNFEVHNTSSGEVIALNSETDANDFEPDIDFPQSEESEEQQTVEINLGDTCIKQLEALFGFPEMFPKGFLPIVQVPLDLAEQLHAFYIQSVISQIETQNSVLDMITQEDEELAKQLQNEVLDDVDDRKTVDLQEIMREQVADRFNRKKLEEWKKLTPDTLAAKLTIQKLTESFPSVQKSILMEILYAHNNSYVETVEVLLASTDINKVNDPDGNIREPPISESVINDMNKAKDENAIDENTPDIPKTANEYREEANDYHRKHNEYMQKAQKAFKNRQYPVAQFYSDLAKSYTRLYEQTNSLAATAFLHEHSNRLQNFHTLDLHYLYVKEAIQALDMFLDANIRILLESNKKKENIFVITGRGKRNMGKSRLKPAVMVRLKKRGLQWVELNPGLLKVKIYPYSATSNNVS